MHPFDGVIERCVAAQAARRAVNPDDAAVTVTFAQSIDGALARRPGQPCRLSGAASMRMTHGLRAVHGAILVGVGTVIADNPSLTVRLVPGGRHPQPVILDSAARTPMGCRLICDAACRRPIVCIAEGARESDAGVAERCAALEAAGARIISCKLAGRSASLAGGGTGVQRPSHSPLRLCLADVAARIGQLGFASVMVEGGSGVLRSALVTRAAFSPLPLACCVIVTVAPRFFISGLPLLAPATAADRGGEAGDVGTSSPAVSLVELAVVQEPPGGDGDLVLCGSLALEP